MQQHILTRMRLVGCIPPAAVAIRRGVSTLPLEQAPPGTGTPWPDPSTSPLWCGPGNLQGMLGYHTPRDLLQGMLGYPLPLPREQTCVKT